MAKKLKLMSLVQELSSRAQVTNRTPAKMSTGVLLMQLRAQANAAPPVRRRFMISVEMHPPQGQPDRVRINKVHVARAVKPEQQPTPVPAGGAGVPQASPQVG
jgi:hypothetical protein